ncbi:unnamed protein product [Arabidopsis halleri]
MSNACKMPNDNMFNALLLTVVVLTQIFSLSHFSLLSFIRISLDLSSAWGRKVGQH